MTIQYNGSLYLILLMTITNLGWVLLLFLHILTLFLKKPVVILRSVRWKDVTKGPVTSPESSNPVQL